MSNASKENQGRLVEWVENASFARINKLFEINAAERAHNVLLLDKNLQVLIKNPNLFIILVFLRLAPPSLKSDEHFMPKDLYFYKIARLADFEGCQDCLEEREKKP